MHLPTFASNTKPSSEITFIPSQNKSDTYVKELSFDLGT